MEPLHITPARSGIPPTQPPDRYQGIQFNHPNIKKDAERKKSSEYNLTLFNKHYNVNESPYSQRTIQNCILTTHFFSIPNYSFSETFSILILGWCVIVKIHMQYKLSLPTDGAILFT
jgi:hypothetical protein